MYLYSTTFEPLIMRIMTMKILFFTTLGLPKPWPHQPRGKGAQREPGLGRYGGAPQPLQETHPGFSPRLVYPLYPNIISYHMTGEHLSLCKRLTQVFYPYLTPIPQYVIISRGSTQPLQEAHPGFYPHLPPILS